MSTTRRRREVLARLIAAGGLVSAALGAGARDAAAHALLLESTPPADSVGAAPPQLVLRFNGRVEKRLSRVELRARDGVAIALDGPAAASPDTLVYPLPPLTPGPWEARWRVLSVDGHVTEGRLRFRIEGP